MRDHFAHRSGWIVLGLSWVMSSGAAAATRCESLAALKLSQQVSIVAKEFPGGRFQPSATVAFDNLPAFCEIVLEVMPQIRIEIWLPLPDQWNHRFNGVGGSGYGGDIAWGSMAVAVRSGFATASTDTGHSSPSVLDGRFALDPSTNGLRWGLIQDFAQRSLHELPMKAKALIQAYYQQPPRFSYFTGCSTGGRQAWMEAQRHPDDYDGILAGAPALSWDRFIMAELWPQIVMQQELGGAIAPAKLLRTTRAATTACAGKDGGLPTDRFLTDPRQCNFDARVHAAALGLTVREAAAIQKIWDGPQDNQGRRLWFGVPKDADLVGGLAGASPFAIAENHVAYWIHRDRNFDWHTLTESAFATDFETSVARFNRVIGTDTADLGPLMRSHTKVITYHGWQDPLIMPGGSIDYFEKLFARYGRAKVDTFARLFMAPGMGHCMGGPGANAFFQQMEPFFQPVPADAQHDAFLALQQWVEHAEPPARIMATQYVDGQAAKGVEFTRPLCVFPRAARFTGQGDSREGANWRCVDGLLRR